QRIAGFVGATFARGGAGAGLLDHTLDRVAERVRPRNASQRRTVRRVGRDDDTRRHDPDRSRISQPIHRGILSGVVIMKRIFVAILLATLAIGWIQARVSAQEQGNISEAEQKRLFREGARLWPVYCNTCHNARPGSEKAPYEWDQIIMHMR